MPVQTISEPTPEELFAAAAPWIVEAIVSTCAKQGYCVLGIVGGRSIPMLLDKLLPYAAQIKGRIEVFWLDERIGSEKNYADALPLLDKLHSAGVDIFWYPLQSVSRGAAEIERHQILQQLAVISGSPKFDVVILSAGEDGHIASLFPHKDALKANDLSFTLVDHAPKPPPLRVTVTPPLLLTASHAFLFFVGDKQHAYDLFCKEGPVDECPARLIHKIEHATVLTSIAPKTG